MTWKTVIRRYPPLLFFTSALRCAVPGALEHEIVEAAMRVNAGHVVVDPLTSILVHESSSDKKRYLVYRLFEAIQSLGCSALITSEGTPRDDDFYPENFLSDGVIIM